MEKFNISHTHTHRSAVNSVNERLRAFQQFIVCWQKAQYYARTLRFSPVCSMWSITRNAASGILVPAPTASLWSLLHSLHPPLHLRLLLHFHSQWLPDFNFLISRPLACVFWDCLRTDLFTSWPWRQVKVIQNLSMHFRDHADSEYV